MSACQYFNLDVVVASIPMADGVNGAPGERDAAVANLKKRLTARTWECTLLAKN
ncbi:hypothetical protein [Streptomyces sp. TRM68367]|uniref:hypothetical protein n=1 Tax=Streptomyces sp. TRM68367 TaxID=2758415 RepID=UPI00165CE134|nr:hypothetical protein [Streptomyces sp. TRM68367]MBC9730389.1 hypothetical protein [Streptomyces sp. TRM68367]